MSETRDYQTVAENELRAAVRAGLMRVLLVSPTGSGKTVMLKNIIKGAVAHGTPTLMIAHRKELIDQTSAKLDEDGIGHGVLMAKHPRARPAELVQVASVATLARRMDRLPPAGLLIIDEAHHARAETYGKLIEHYKDAPVIGATATPWRTDGKGLKELFDRVVVASTVRKLIDQGYLVHFDGFGFENPSLKDVSTLAGDYNELELAEQMNTAKLVGGIVERWVEHSFGRRTVAFSVNVAHSRAIVAAFQAHNVPAEHLDGKTPDDEREGILARLKSGETLVVSNCAVLTEGWDCPEAETAILARPTKSIVVYLQQAGRVLRPAPGKTTARIHDHAGVLLHHGLPDEDRDYSLESDVTRKRTQTGIHQCPECLRIGGALEARCTCGHVFEEPAEERDQGDGGGTQIEYFEGQQLSMDEIRRLREATVYEKAAEYKRLLLVAQRVVRNGDPKKWAAWRYRETFNVWPRFADGVLDQVAPAREPPVPLHRLKQIAGSA